MIRFWLNVITAVFPKKKKKKKTGSCSQYLMYHLAMHRPGRRVGRSASRDPGTLLGIILSCWAFI